MTQKRSTKVVRNTVYSAAARLWEILVALFLSPYIIRHVGVEGFGIWALISVLTGYFGLMDFGIRASFVRFMAEYHAQDDPEKVNRVVSTGFLFYLVLGLLFCLAAFPLLGHVIRFLNVPPALVPEAGYVFMVGLVIFAVSNALSPVGALQTGLQRMELTGRINVAVSVPNVLGTVLALESGLGLPGLIMNSAAISVLNAAINFWAAHRIMPRFRFDPLVFDRAIFRDLLGYGYKVQITAWAGWLNTQMVKILLARFLGVSAVSFYSLAENVIGKLKEFPLMLAAAVMPAASEMQARTEAESLRALYFRTMKYQALVLLPIAGGVWLLGGRFMTLWIGPSFDEAAAALRILMAGTVFNILTSPGAAVLNGMGKPQYAMWSAMIAIPVNLVLSILLVIKIGFYGIPVAVAVSLGVSGLYFIVVANRIMRFSLREITDGALLKPLAAAAGAFLLLYAFGARDAASAGWHGFAGAVAAYLLVYSGLVALLGHFDAFDRELLARCFGAVSARLGRAR